MILRDLAAILVTGFTITASTMPAAACGTVKIYASAYLAADGEFTSKLERTHCQMRIFGFLLCVDKSYLKEQHAKRLLTAVLAHAKNSVDPRLQCAGQEVARHFSIAPAAKPDTGKPPLGELITAIRPSIPMFCKAGDLRTDAEALIDVPEPAYLRLRGCLIK